MYLTKLELTDFRNYRQASLEPDRYLNLIAGPNAQGKTNLLEAVFFLLTGRSFRTAKDGEIIRRGAGFFAISCRMNTRFGEIEIAIKVKPGEKKFLVNGSAVRGFPLGRPGAVLFSPDDLALVKGSPQERRAFLDQELCPLQPRYTQLLQRYQRALQQRNNLLREIRERRQPRENLEPWNEQLCRYGAGVLHGRFAVLKKFAPLAGRLHRDISAGKEFLDLRYNASVRIEDGKTEADLYRSFRRSLDLCAKEEVDRAHTLVGPHRDDVSFYINGSDARVFGSRGQQRTVVLALKTGLIDLWERETGDQPLLLLDDVLFELDATRQKSLLDRVFGSVQTFITTAGKNSLSGFAKPAPVFQIENGRIAGFYRI
ncbi:MAG: DNA replication/repair protein RecF [Firmicutes bacterium]|nr:DNA replication/repair protein RecF [Bacillota bacterium]